MWLLFFFLSLTLSMVVDGVWWFLTFPFSCFALWMALRPARRDPPADEA